jgi:hypothetical protein
MFEMLYLIEIRMLLLLSVSLLHLVHDGLIALLR